MSKISDKNKERIMEDIVAVMHENSLKPLNTKHIADRVIRDNEFTLTLLKQLEKRGIIRQIKNPRTKQPYIKRKKWIMTKEAYKKYSELQQDNTHFSPEQ